MTKTIEEEIQTYAQICSVDEAGYVAIEKAVQFGIKLHKSLPLSQRLTDAERARVRTMYNSLYAFGYISACGLRLELESIFGKELFGEE